MAALFNEGDDEPAGIEEAVPTDGTPAAADRNTEPGFTTKAVIAAGAHRASIERIGGAILSVIRFMSPSVCGFEKAAARREKRGGEGGRTEGGREGGGGGRRSEGGREGGRFRLVS